MAHMGFFDLSDRYASLHVKRDPLVEIDAVVPWEEFRPALEEVWRKPEAERKSRAGREPMDAVVRPTHSDRRPSGSNRWRDDGRPFGASLFKTLVLSALYNLSDVQIKYQVRDRLSFI